MGSANDSTPGNANNGNENNAQAENTAANTPAAQTEAQTDTGGSVPETTASTDQPAAGQPLEGAAGSDDGQREVKVIFSGLFKGEKVVPVGTAVQDVAKLFTDTPMTSLSFREEGNGNRAVAATRKLEGDINVVAANKGGSSQATARISVGERARGG